MKITVQHAKMDRQSGTVIEFIPVADVNVPEEISAFGTTEDCLEYAYRYTNNINGSWSRKIGSDANDNVTVLADLVVSNRSGQPMGLRSSMMNDRFIINGEAEYKCAAFGFDRVVSSEELMVSF